MSVNYDIRYEVRSQHDISKTTDAIVTALREASYLYSSIEPDYRDFEEIDGQRIFVIEGMMALHGQSCEDAHKDINKIIQTKVDPHATVATRWHVASGFDWDEEFEADEA